MKVSHAIMAHPSRANHVEELHRQIPGSRVIWDERNDRWDTGRRSMLAYEPDADWHCVTQDDAVLCADFVPGVHKALEAVGDNPVAFYMGKVRPNQEFVRKAHRIADREGSHWIAMKGPWWGVAIAVPCHLIDGMVEWCDGRPDIANYDRRMSRYFESLKIECWYSAPSLVDHRVGPENPSLVPGRSNSPTRVAYRFIGDDSPLDIDWQTEPVHPRGSGAISQPDRRSLRDRTPSFAKGR